MNLQHRHIIALSVLILVNYWIYFIYAYNKLPEIIPSHFTNSGYPDGYESKVILIDSPKICTVLYFLCTVIYFFVERYGYLLVRSKLATPSSSNNSLVFILLALLIVIVFFIITLATIGFINPFTPIELAIVAFVDIITVISLKYNLTKYKLKSTKL